MTEIRTLTIKDIRQAKRLSDAELWNQTEEDWKFLIENPGTICIAASLREKIVGTATAMNYEDKISWIGMVLVDREFRGKGISKLLLTELLQQLKSFRSVKLDATPAGHKIYHKFGFQDEFIIHRMTIDSVPAKKVDLKNNYSEKIFPIANISEVAEFDRHVFGADRSPLIKFLKNNFHEVAWMLKEKEKVSGFSLGRNGSRFYHIGPVTASSTEMAVALISKALETINNRPVAVDVLDEKKDLIDFLTSVGFQKERHLIRMYRNPHPSESVNDYQFIVSGPEFG